MCLLRLTADLWARTVLGLAGVESRCNMSHIDFFTSPCEAPGSPVVIAIGTCVDAIEVLIDPNLAAVAASYFTLLGELNSIV